MPDVDALLVDDVREDAIEVASEVAMAVVTTVVNIRVFTPHLDDPSRPALPAGCALLLTFDPEPELGAFPPPPRPAPTL